MAEKLLHGDVVVAFVADVVGEEGVVQDAVLAEHLLGEPYLSLLAQFHDACGRDEFAHGSNPHDGAGAHGLFLLLVGKAVTLCEEK